MERLFSIQIFLFILYSPSKFYLSLKLMETHHSKMTEISLNANKINTKVLLFVIPFLIVFAGPFLLIWPVNLINELTEIAIVNIFSTLGILFSGIILHELIHGLFWSFFNNRGFSSIKFGIMWSSFAPYCHCNKPMKLKYYRIGAMMPGLLLGFIPSIIAIFTGSFALLAFGIIFSIGAGGDFLMIWMLRNEKNNIWVQDHPNKIGCFILNELAEKD